MKRFILILISVCCLTGCDLWVLYKFRGQLQQLPKHARWEDQAGGRMLVISEPLLTLENLKNLNLSPKPTESGLLSIRYRYHADKSEGVGETEMFFLMEGGKLRGVTFPTVIYNMFGQQNLEALLCAAGGDSSQGKSIRIEKAQVLRAVFGSEAWPVDDRKITVVFEPIDEENRRIELSFDETKKPGVYSSLGFVFGTSKK